MLSPIKVFSGAVHPTLPTTSEFSELIPDWTINDEVNLPDANKSIVMPYLYKRSIPNNDEDLSRLVSFLLSNQIVQRISRDVLVNELKTLIANMEYLNLAKQNVDDRGARFLSEALSDNTSLKSISLKDNNIGAAGIKALASTLSKNSSLIALDLGMNQIGDDELPSLMMSLVKNNSLKVLSLSGNQISVRGVEIIGKMLQRNTSLWGLNLSSNLIDDRGFLFLADSLASNAHLRQLNLTGNSMSDESIKPLRALLKSNTTLKVIHLNDNEMSSQGLSELLNEVQVNYPLMQLHLVHSKTLQCAKAMLGAYSTMSPIPSIQLPVEISDIITEYIAVLPGGFQTAIDLSSKLHAV